MEQLKKCSTDFFASRLQHFYRIGIQKLPDKRHYVVDSDGSYICKLLIALKKLKKLKKVARNFPKLQQTGCSGYPDH